MKTSAAFEEELQIDEDFKKMMIGLNLHKILPYRKVLLQAGVHTVGSFRATLPLYMEKA